MNSKNAFGSAMLVLVAALIALATPGFLAGRAWAMDVSINGLYSCEHIKTKCDEAGGAYHVQDVEGSKSGEKFCQCNTLCRKETGSLCGISCTASPKKIGPCRGWVPLGHPLGTGGAVSPAQILRALPRGGTVMPK